MDGRPHLPQRHHRVAVPDAEADLPQLPVTAQSHRPGWRPLLPPGVLAQADRAAPHPRVAQSARDEDLTAERHPHVAHTGSGPGNELRDRGGVQRTRAGQRPHRCLLQVQETLYRESQIDGEVRSPTPLTAARRERKDGSVSR
jgi:hypothetical protein